MRYRWNPRSACRTIDGTAFVLLGERMVRLNEVGTFLWERLEHGAGVDELVPLVVEAFDTSQDQASTDTSAFVTNLLDEQMLVRS